jgi:hypothetical protein
MGKHILLTLPVCQYFTFKRLHLAIQSTIAILFIDAIDDKTDAANCGTVGYDFFGHG